MCIFFLARLIGMDFDFVQDNELQEAINLLNTHIFCMGIIIAEIWCIEKKHCFLVFLPSFLPHSLPPFLLFFKE